MGGWTLTQYSLGALDQLDMSSVRHGYYWNRAITAWGQSWLIITFISGPQRRQRKKDLGQLVSQAQSVSCERFRNTDYIRHAQVLRTCHRCSICDIHKVNTWRRIDQLLLKVTVTPNKSHMPHTHCRHNNVDLLNPWLLDVRGFASPAWLHALLK